MPRMNGRELATRVRQMHPTIRILYMSGYTDPNISPSTVAENGASFLQKPFSPEVLARTVREVFDGPRD
jgi:two-component system, cell cycle sensor histidine kinase and response regulator CckA